MQQVRQAQRFKYHLHLKGRASNVSSDGSGDVKDGEVQIGKDGGKDNCDYIERIKTMITEREDP
ncbi:hypothetical protein BGZ65_011560, partial [Modicella reniformis]